MATTTSKTNEEKKMMVVDTTTTTPKTILVLKCLDCGYARVQTKQDIYAIELKMLRDCHSKTFTHRMKGLRLSRSDPFALKLRDNLQRWEKW